MKNFYQNIIVFFLSVGLIMILGWWIFANPTQKFTQSNPGLDKKNANQSRILESIKIGEFFKRFSKKTPELNESWPRFRGENFDNIHTSNIKLLDKFKSPNPDTLWSVKLGEGHAGASVYKGLVYLLDYDEEQKADMLKCFSLIDGKEIWRRWYNVHVKRNHGMSRTVPAITDKYILTIGPRCHVMCVERETGNFLWGIDIEKEYESEVPLWYTGQCPLIDNGIAVLATGGKALIIGVDCATGEKLWETPNENEWKMSHASVMPYVFGNRRMYVYSAVGGICGIATDKNVGEILWQTSVWNHSVVAPSPVCMPDGKIFLTAGYGAGSMILQLTENNGKFTVETYQEYKPSEGLACEQQTPVYADGHLFGIMPKDGGTLRNQFICVNPADCKNIVWSSGKTNRFGLGPYILADNKFYLLNDDGTLFIIKKSSKQYIQLDALKIFDGHDAWAPLAIADGYMLLRDSKKMYCLNIKS